MNDTAATTGATTTATGTAHPLDPLTGAEIRAARGVLERAGHVGESTRFPLLTLHEPAKAERRAGEAVERRAFAVLLDTTTGAAGEALVSLERELVLEYRALPSGEYPFGQPSILFEEFDLVDGIVRADPHWQAAMHRRGITELDLVYIAPLSAGQFGFAEEAGRRILRSLSFLRHAEQDSPWAHPVEGLIAYVDLVERRVFRLVDESAVPVPAECGNYDEAAVGGHRSSLRPLEITQPEGPSFHVDGNEVRWENWRFRVGFDAREGLVLHSIRFRDGDRERPVIDRASVPEMVVPYGDPSASRFWISYFDAGEYLFGKNTNSLVLGCDCLGEIHYFDATLADERGEPYVLRNAVCMHEEDHGVQWKHTDAVTGSAETRRSRRLVVSSFVTVGNYDYGFYWYLYLDGTVALETKATGIVFTGAAIPGQGSPHGTEVAPGLIAPFHQHFFCARLDMAVDGTTNTVEEVDVEQAPPGPDNPYGNAWHTRTTPLTTESEAARCAEPAAARTWRIVNPTARNRLGQPVAYQLVPQGGATLLVHQDAPVARRAAFATRHLWVTPYDPAERYPAGDYPNQHAGGAGLPTWTSRNRSIDGEDLVVWHTFGLTHVPRTEDWPVMPVDTAGFTLRPNGFFDRNPTLDLPRSTSGHCHANTGAGCHDGG